MSADTLIVRSADGEFLLSTKAMSLIFGVSEVQVIDHIGSDPQDAKLQSLRTPMFWIQNGRRRIREAFAAIGTEDLASALLYLDRMEGASK